MKAKIVCLTLSTIVYSCKWLAARSYPFVESYNLPLEKNTVVDVIAKFKNDNPQFNLPDTIYNKDFLLIGIKDGHKHGENVSGDHWYFSDFYDKEQDQIIRTWVRKSGRDDNESTFALVSIKKDARTGPWQRVNDDLTSKANDAAIQRFETLILEPIKQRLQPLLPPERAIENNNNW